MSDVNEKANYFQHILLVKYQECFPIKSFKISKDDQPWISKEVKELDRQRKREFFKNHKSEKWKLLHEKYIFSVKKAKISYSTNIVRDLKSSNPAQWYSKVKRMANVNKCTDGET